MLDAVALRVEQPGELRRAIDRAADALAGALTAADILDARDQAAIVYDAAKSAARLARAKGAHDEIIARAYRAQADALEIESLAKRRLADEYDAAQDRGEVAGHGGKRGNQHTSVKSGKVAVENLAEKLPTVADAGLTKPQIFEARTIRDAIEQEPGKLRRILDDILEAGEEPTKAKLRRELAPAITKMRAQATTEKKERRAQKEIALAGRIEALPNRRYDVILADPEWRFEPYSRESGMDRSADNHYPTSATDDIAARDIGSIAADDCVLFLWATAPMLPDALDVMKAWGFTYKSHAVWHKEREGEGRGTGYWFLGEHELLLVGTKGVIPAPAMGTQARSVFGAPVGEHSAKPETALEIIEGYFPNLPKIELNRRGPARPGWDAWGNEAESAVDPELYAKALAVVCGMPEDLGRLIRATRISEKLDISWEAAVEIAVRIEEAGPLSLAEKVIAVGLAPNAYILELNRGLTNPHPLDLPSRLFRIPVEYMDHKRTGGEARLLLRHPLLFQYLPVADFLNEIEEKTGVRPEWADADEFGRDFGGQGRWWHAVDLCNDKHWRDLLNTRQFTDRDNIFSAVQLAMEGKSLSLKNARALMTALESAEPDRDVSEGAMLENGIWPYRHDKGKLISPNIRARGEASAWMVIHGLEGKLFSYVGSHLSVTEAFMERLEKTKETAVPLPLGDVAIGRAPDTESGAA